MARLALVFAGAASVLLAVRCISHQMGPAFLAPSLYAPSQSVADRWMQRPVQQVVPKQAFKEPQARSRFGFLGLCAALTLPVVVSRITCGAKWGRRKPNKPTDWSHERLGYRIKGGPGWNGSPHTWTERIRWVHRYRRRIHIRRKVEGTTARPRLAVFRSQMHMHASVIDDTIGTGVTMIQVTSKQAGSLEQIRAKQGCDAGSEKTWSMDAAEIVGAEVAKQCLEKGITMVVFDRAGFPYEGRVKAVAEAARSGGLQF
ncbi:rplR [Symbiodinium pilosum]|uniref:Large ribosomal subunit protein uL18c n=1 Tax=Symbiodinium pilosum TaxID=2952 RepID=A0A812W399_SYMPI|nr:rplR [Symbiodinium pilosum]